MIEPVNGSMMSYTDKADEAVKALDDWERQNAKTEPGVESDADQEKG